MHEHALRVPLTSQEVEFALACREFIIEHDPILGRLVTIENGELVVPEVSSSRKVFLDYGLARLLRVFRLAIENKAVPLELVPTLIADLALFNEKIVKAFAAIPSSRQFH